MSESLQKRDSLLLFAVLFILIVATVSIMAVFFTKDKIENDIKQRLDAQLDNETLSINMDGRDVYIQGKIGSPDELQPILNSLQQMDGVRHLESQIEIDPALVEPKQETAENQQQTNIVIMPATMEGQFSLRFDSGKWQFSGDIDSSDTEKMLLDSLNENIAQDISNQLSVLNTDSKPTWVDHILQTLEPFSLIQGSAELSLTDGLLLISGDVNSQTEKRMVLMSLRESFGENAQIQDALRILSFKGANYVQQAEHALEQLDLSALVFTENDKKQQSVQDDDKQTLVKIAETLKQTPSLIIEIGGHTADNGDVDQDRQNSLERSLAIKQWLVNQDVNKEQLRTIGYGSERPIADLTEKQNERVEIRIIKGG